MIVDLNATFRKCPQLVGFGLCVFLALAGQGCSQHESAVARPEATLEEMNAALATWVMVKGGLPQNVHELTNFPALKEKRLPTPPEGQRLVIDLRSRKVTFMSE